MCRPNNVPLPGMADFRATSSIRLQAADTGQYFVDEQLDKGQKIEQLLAEIASDRAERSEASAGGGPALPDAGASSKEPEPK